MNPYIGLLIASAYGSVYAKPYRLILISNLHNRRVLTLEKASHRVDRNGNQVI